MNTYEVSQLLERKREDNRRKRSARIRWLEQKVPEYRDLTSRRNALLAGAAVARVGGKPDEAIVQEQEAAELDRREAEILSGLGLPEDFLQMHYDCPLCKDVGFTPDGGMCQCLKKLIRDAAFQEYDLTAKVAEDNFDNYDMEIFSKETAENSAWSPRQLAGVAYNTTTSYCRNFGKDSRSLILYGSVGTGKTFVVSCMVNELMKKDVDLIYLSAPNIVNLVFDDINRKTPMKESNKERLKEVDLLFIDDLGTEADNSFNRSLMSEILDERQLSGKQTVITTNYIPGGNLKTRYPERMVSRIDQCFDRLIFAGPDLRKIKKNRNKNQIPGGDSN